MKNTARSNIGSKISVIKKHTASSDSIQSVAHLSIDFIIEVF